MVMKPDKDKDIRRLYDDLAWTWPIISPPEEYLDETDELMGLVEKHAEIQIKRILNLGCGGGHNDFALKRKYEVTSVDISDAMLNLARKLNPEVEYHNGDMRTVRMNQQFDCVTIFDSINYMCTVDDLREAFRTAYEHLKPGGIFATYIEEWKERFKQNKTSHLIRKKDDIEIVLVENYYDPDPNDTWYEGNLIYIIRRAGKLTIETDSHIVGIFPLQTWTDICREVGFEVFQIPSTITDGTDRVCPVIIGRRPRESR
jgi:SAM-dependent methyltransferase